MLTVSTNYSTAISKTLTQPGFLVKVGWATPKYFSSRGTVVFTIPGDTLPSTFVSTPITVSAINTDVTAKSTGSLTIGIDVNEPLKVTQYALSSEFGFANTPIDIWLYDSGTIYTLKWASVGSTSYLISSPDSAANSITNDIDIRADILANDWTPASVGSIISKRETAGQVSYRFTHTTGGYLYFEFSLLGTTVASATSTAAHTFTDVSRHWVRVTRVALTGVVTFYTSLDGITWTRLGNPVTGTAGDIFNSNSKVEIGSYLNGTAEFFVGKIYKVQAYNGISGTPYALLDGTSGGYLTTPDATANRILGDIEITVAAALDDYTTVAFQTLLAKFVTTGNQRAWYFGIGNGLIQFFHSLNGSTGASATRTLPTLTAGQLYYFKVTWSILFGNTAFYYSTDGVTFTQIGTTQTMHAGGATFNSNASISIGAYDSGATSIAKGKIYSAKILSGVDGQKVVEFSLTGITNSPATITSPTTGEVWTVNGSAKIGGNIAIDFNAQDSTAGTGPFTSSITGETWTITGAGGAVYQAGSTANELNAGDAVKVFKGIGDSATLDSLGLKTTLIPVNLISSVAPRVRINPRNGFNYIQPRGTIVNWGTDRFTLE